jgi:hypothetical protein
VLLTQLHNGDPEALRRCARSGNATTRSSSFDARQHIGLSRERHVHNYVSGLTRQNARCASLQCVRACCSTRTWRSRAGDVARIVDAAETSILERLRAQRSVGVVSTLDPASDEDVLSDDAAALRRRRRIRPDRRHAHVDRAGVSRLTSGEGVPDSGGERRCATATGRESKLRLSRLLRRIDSPQSFHGISRRWAIRDCVVPGATVLHGDCRGKRRAAIATFQRGGVLLPPMRPARPQPSPQLPIVVNLGCRGTRCASNNGSVALTASANNAGSAFHLIAEGTAGVRVLQRLGIRIARAQADIGAGILSKQPVHRPIPRGDETDGSEASPRHERLTLAQLAPAMSKVRYLSRRRTSRPCHVFEASNDSSRPGIANTCSVSIGSCDKEGGHAIAYHLTPALLRLRHDRRGRYSDWRPLAKCCRAISPATRGSHRPRHSHHVLDHTTQSGTGSA